MASALANRTASAARFSRQSFSLVRQLNTSSSPNATTFGNPTAASTAAEKPKSGRKNKNLFEVARFLPIWGLGFHIAKSHWINVSYEITKINLSARHGKAWGIAYKDGLPAADAPKKISGVHKRCWKYIPSSRKTEETTPELEVQAA